MNELVLAGLLGGVGGLTRGVVGQKGGSVVIAFPPNLKNRREIVTKLQSIGLLQEKAKIRKRKEEELMDEGWKWLKKWEKELEEKDNFFDWVHK